MLKYPDTRKQDCVDTVAAVSFPDPYRWLEQETDEVRNWQRVQAELASAHVREWPEFDRLHALVERFSFEQKHGDQYRIVPRFTAGRWFRTRGVAGTSYEQAVCSMEPMGEGVVLFDTSVGQAGAPCFISWLAPSPDGKELALGLCTDGSENNSIRLIDVASGRALDGAPEQKLMDNWTGGAQWLADSSGFFFTGIHGTGGDFEQQVYFHSRRPTDLPGFFTDGIKGTSAELARQPQSRGRQLGGRTIAVDIPWTERKDYRWVVVSRDGRHAVAMERLVNPIPVAIAQVGAAHSPLEGIASGLSTAALAMAPSPAGSAAPARPSATASASSVATGWPLDWRAFVNRVGGRLSGHLVGNRFIAVTDVGASRGRVVAVPLDSSNPNDPACWVELVAESDAALQTITVVGDSLYISELVDTYARVRIVSLEGEPKGEVPLPGRGAMGIGWWYSMHGTFPRGHADKFLFTFSSLTDSPGIYCHTPGEGRLEVLQPPAVRLNGVVVEDHWAVSRDGTRIPFHIVRREDVDAALPQPTMIYAYGGFNYPLVPQFPGAMAAVVEAGGVYVHAHLRGGSEFGNEWAHLGRQKNKQNCYDDLYAVAEHLIAAGRCTPQTLAFTGRSLGGHLAGVAATQRPDLWKVVVPRVPILDPIGACRDSTYGRMAVVMELADPDDAADVRRLGTISPYHLIRDGVKYPAVFIDAGDTDPRCAPWHARKFAARLQAATGGESPVLLHIWENAGHGLATDKRIAIAEQTEWIAFTLRHLGVTAP